MARSLYAAGVRQTDVFQNMSSYGLFTGNLSFQYDIKRLGCLSIPAGAGNNLRQIKLMRDFQYQEYDYYVYKLSLKNINC